MPTNLAGWWPLDNATTGSTTTIDESGNFLTGTLVHSVTTGTTGVIQQAFTFPSGTVGSLNYVQVSCNTCALDATGTMSATAWVKFTAGHPASSEQIISKGFDGTNTQYQLFADATGKMNFSTYNGSTHGVISASSISTTTFQFWAGTFNGATYRIFLNGALDNSSTDAQGPIHTAQDVLIGGAFNMGAPVQTCACVIDDPRIYIGTALTGSQVSAIYNSGLAGKP